MATATPSVGRIDDIIKELVRLHADAQGIFDAHVDYLCSKEPKASFGAVKTREIARPAGNALDYIAALKVVRQKIVGV
jgi:hypothetical protein